MLHNDHAPWRVAADEQLRVLQQLETTELLSSGWDYRCSLGLG